MSSKLSLLSGAKFKLFDTVTFSPRIKNERTLPDTFSAENVLVQNSIWSGFSSFLE